MIVDRRKFLKAAALTGVATAQHRQAFSLLPVQTANLSQDAERPQFHLLPARNWMNDPNGPIYFNGQYHMFFQHNPFGPLWGNMSWGHAVSPDMLHWRHLPLALTPTPGSADAYGCFSGSALQLGRRVYFVYTGTVKSDPQTATIKQDNVRESQCLAWSEDPQLISWTKAKEPILPLPPAGLKVTGFRDPSMWRQDGQYYMTVGSGLEGVGGCVLLYRSQDLHAWEYLHPLTSGTWTGQHTKNPCDDGEMWECPEFFPLDDGHILIYSTLGKVFWQSGTFDKGTLTFQPKKNGLFDLGDTFYAPKTQLDAKGRRIIWGWLREQRGDAALQTAGWAGMMSLPRLLRLRPDGTLAMDILPEIATLRSGQLHVAGEESASTVVMNGASGELYCSAGTSQSFTCRVAHDANEILHIEYSPERAGFLLDGKLLPVAASAPVRIHLFLDASVLEVIVNGSVSYTKRFYLSQINAPDLVVRLLGSKLNVEAWSIKPISPDRLTTPALG